MTVSELYSQYFNERQASLNEAEFEIFAALFPTLLVIMADDEFQDPERKLVEQIIQEIVTGLEDEFASIDPTRYGLATLKDRYAAEVTYILNHLAKYETVFIETLSIYLQINDEYKEIVLEMMTQAAQVHEGINERELAKIYELKTKLGII